MTDIPRLLLKVLANSLTASLLCLLVGWLSAGGSWAESLFGLLGLYGALATGLLFVAYIIMRVLELLAKRK